jgi:protein phosphatase
MKVVMADYFEVRLGEKDQILMCTDGLTNMVEDDDIMGLVKQKASLEEKVNSLIASANNHGGKDNIGVILIEV